MPPHLLIVEARFYDDMADALLEGATDALQDAGATYEVITVDGALEIPAAIAMALDGMDDEAPRLMDLSRLVWLFAVRPIILKLFVMNQLVA